MNALNLRLLSVSNDPDDLVKALIDLPRDRLAEAKPQLEALITHPDADVRVQAMRRLMVHLKDPSRHSDAVNALRRDPEIRVRRVAAYAISATTGAGTYQQDVGALLTSLLDTAEDVDVRGAAYEALLLLHDRRDFPPANREIDLTRDVDWAWVNALHAGISRDRPYS